MQYIGFIIDGCVPTIRNCIKSNAPLTLLRGWPSTTAVAEMRFKWVAEYINGAQREFHYELYRPWKKYCVVVFLKSMGHDSQILAKKLKDGGTKILFDANVDYFTPRHGTFYYEGMAPTDIQRKAAIEMASISSAVIGDSEHISKVANKFNKNVCTIEDNVRENIILEKSPWGYNGQSKIPLLWSGQAVKLFELLAIKDFLLHNKEHCRLRIITNSLSALDKWYQNYKAEFTELLEKMDHEIISFTSIEDLMAVYDKGGVAISPRFLNNSYNLGHTEWKITLPLARGRVVLCSPQQSYVQACKNASGRGIRICDTSDDWQQALEEILSPGFDWGGEQSGAISVVRNCYSTKIIADKHLRLIQKTIQ